MKNKHSKGWIINIVCILGILGIFAISGLVLTSVGVQVYKNIVFSNTENFKLRTSLSFVATKIRQFDEQDSITLSVKDETPMLVLSETVDGVDYDTMIYYYDGKLCELYQENGSDYELSYGQEIAAVADFKIEQKKENLLQLTAHNTNGESESLYINIKTKE